MENSLHSLSVSSANLDHCVVCVKSHRIIGLSTCGPPFGFFFICFRLFLKMFIFFSDQFAIAL